MDLTQIITAIGVVISLVLSVLNYIFSHKRKARTDKELTLLKAQIDIMVDKEKKLFEERSKAYPEICENNYRARVKCREVLNNPASKVHLKKLKEDYDSVYECLFLYTLVMKNDNVFLLQHNFKNAIKEFLEVSKKIDVNQKGSNNEQVLEKLNNLYSEINLKQNELDNLINSKINYDILELKQLENTTPNKKLQRP